MNINKNLNQLYNKIGSILIQKTLSIYPKQKLCKSKKNFIISSAHKFWEWSKDNFINDNPNIQERIQFWNPQESFW